MDKMNELIEKYFRAETSLTEENELKHYFLAGKVLPEHEPYRALFEAFDEELHETVDSSSKKKIQFQHYTKRFWIQTISISGIAATLLLAFWFMWSQQNNDFAIMRGKRINNQEYAQQYARAKFEKVNEALAKSIEPMESIKKVREGIKPVQKINETRELMKEIKNKLQY
jgi:hypothetical protein